MNKLRISEIFEKVMPEQASLLKAVIIGKKLHVAQNSEFSTDLIAMNLSHQKFGG